MIEAVIFDIGGVLAFDVWEHLLLENEGGVASLYDLDRELVWQVGKKIWEEFAYQSIDEHHSLQELEGGYWKRFLEDTDLSVPVDELIGLTDGFIRPVNGMEELVSRLYSTGIKMGICSDNNEFWFQRQFNKLRYYQFFDPACVILSNRVGVSKKSLKFEMFQEAIEAVEVAKESCLFVDDRITSVENAVRFGLPALLFPSHAVNGHKYLELIFEKLGLL